MKLTGFSWQYAKSPGAMNSKWIGSYYESPEDRREYAFLAFPELGSENTRDFSTGAETP